MTYTTTNIGPAEPRGLVAPLVRVRDWLDERGRWAWIAAMVLGFIVFWPVGLAILGYMIWRKRMFCNHGHSHGGFSGRYSNRFAGRSTGNSAFDSYREATLKRLEDEHDQFMNFLQQLREAKDKAEFDEFMRQRKDKAMTTEVSEV